ncbi:hypothetical protein BDW74DRAFT_168483 [Aspergillus multicolor]|uniref:uncharacterized protein n=1 Tax=Aspergillus multicolor TaxID=41759 RepID=UPI003CCE2047
MDLLRCYQDIWLSLPEHVRDGKDTVTNTVLARTQHRMKQRTAPLPDLLLNDPSRPALIDPTSNQQLSYARLRSFINDFELGLPFPAQGRPRVAVMLPNGPILALAVIAIANRYTMIPMARTVAPEQLRADIEAVEADAIVLLESDVDKVQLDENLPVFTVNPQPDLTFTVASTNPAFVPAQRTNRRNPDDAAVLLFTSGTSGKKKLVPITAYNLFASAVFTMDSVALDGTSRCANMMPLHHVGGMIRSLYAPMLAGSSTICCASFDPSLFWDVVEAWNPTWYYATPTMHQMILAESEHRPDALAQSQIQFIINAGGGLPATLAVQLREVFQCTVLPSYGMTECAPIVAPPTNYKLDREGTSGRPVGPDVAILDGSAQRAPTGVTGRICVRGFPVFPGYLTEQGVINKDAFDANGWFDTGDLGHQDDEGYLFITGRSKEVVNRGGEIISPIEVESGILSAARDPSSALYGRISETLAFSTPHDVLQEVVGAVIVTPPGKARPDLRQLHEALAERLLQPKWPALIVYMDEGVPKSNNKLQRIRLSQRLGLDTLTDATPVAERHFEAKCPPQGTPLTVSIPHTSCMLDGQKALPYIVEASGNPDVVMRHNPIDGFPQAIFFNSESQSPITVAELSHSLRSSVHGYLIPSSVKSLPGQIPLDLNGYVDEKAVDEALWALNASADSSSTEYRVRDIFAQALNQAIDEVCADTDFFAAGGDSLSAGRLISTLRREFGIRLSGDVLFLHPTVGDITDIVDEACAKKAPEGTPVELPGCEKMHSSTNPIVLTLQLLPMLVFYPMRVGLQWTIFVFLMGETARLFPPDGVLMGRLLHIVLIGLASRIAIGTIAPVFAILCKWLLIGRYKAGLYPMWGSYHTRWWLTQKAIKISGKGVFNYFDFTRNLYYRLLGCHIGRNVTIHQSASLGEYDLIRLEDNVILENCIVRPFAVERNTSMLLQPISIGSGSQIGLRTVVAPGSNLPPNTFLGPNSSSWEIDSSDEANKELNSAAIQGPHWFWSLLLVEPLGLVAGFAYRLPWLAGLIPIVMHYPLHGYDMLRVIVFWFTNPTRIGWHILARIYYAVGGPIVWFIAILMIKTFLDLTCGRAKTGPISKMSQRQKIRQAALFKVLPNGSLGPITRLIGKHYELVSVAIRLLGGRVGKRIYWPSVGPGIQDFDLVEVGNDVVFGSRSYLVTSDGSGRERVTISDGAMLGDRAVVLPGVTIGEMAMVGSGSLLRRNGFYAPDTVWTGSKNGNAIQFPSIGSNNNQISLHSEKPKTSAPSSSSASATVTATNSGSSSPEPFDEKAFEAATCQLPLERDTTRPFGRAFYQGFANFFVIPIFGIVCYSTFMVILSTVWRLMGVLAGLLVLAHALRQEYRAFDREWWQPFAVYGLFTAVVSAVSFAQTIIGVTVVIAAKWAVMGRRTEGAYHWDKSSYNQRWQFYLTVETLIKDSYRGIGVLPMLSGTAYLNTIYRLMGATIGKDCSLLSNGDPNILLTEPDMVTLGDRVAVDDASLVCHLNTRGEFELHPLVVGDRSILRTGSRLMSGATMGKDAGLLEHTLVLSGDCVDDAVTMQGWPAEPFEGRRVTL